jgi:DNA-binding response OmpR family regulator
MMPTALIVEDEPEANRLLSLLVQMRGYDTESAFTGGEALEIVRRHRPDIVFLDLMLPDTNGFEVCTALKGNRKTSMIPVVMVTARMAAENRQMSYRVGASDYVPKPYTPDQIFDAMAAADSWKRDIEGHADVGEIAIDTRDDVEPFAEIGRLQSLLLLRTRWDEESVRQFHADLVAMTQALLDWGRHHGVQRVAKIRYDLSTERVALDIEDGSGCFGAEDLPHDQALGKLIGQGRFDVVQFSETGDVVHLSKQSVSQGELPIS